MTELDGIWKSDYILEGIMALNIKDPSQTSKFETVVSKAPSKIIDTIHLHKKKLKISGLNLYSLTNI